MIASRAVETLKSFLLAFRSRDLGPAQQLPAGEKFRLLLEQDSLQKRNRVTEIAELNRRHGF